mmetsp:Transcript_120411/g.374938  ORF Transcript_120411/g.374938 Transcript_120411/m.374938 type:complete len:201 (+) Transcript_120411:109-711(+)
MSQVSKCTVSVCKRNSMDSLRLFLMLVVVTPNWSGTTDMATPVALSFSLCSAKTASTFLIAGIWQQRLVMPMLHCWRHMSSHQIMSMKGPHKPQYQQQRVRLLRVSLTSLMAPRTSPSSRPSAVRDSRGILLSASRLLKPPHTQGFMTTMSTVGHSSLPSENGFETERAPMKKNGPELMAGHVREGLGRGALILRPNGLS